MKVLLAAFDRPGTLAIMCMLEKGLDPGQIRLLTHDLARNQDLIQYASDYRIEMRMSHVKSTETRDWIEDFAPDVLFSLYFRDIIPQYILDIPPLGCVNLHPALLPKYRGCFSAPWVIINGESETGYTYHRMVSKTDEGPIIWQERIPIMKDDTAYALYHRLLDTGMAAFGRVFDLVTLDRIPGVAQVGEPSYYSRKVPFGGYIDPAWSQDQVERFIRAMYFPPFRGAILRRGEQEIEIRTIGEYVQAMRHHGLERDIQ